MRFIGRAERCHNGSLLYKYMAYRGIQLNGFGSPIPTYRTRYLLSRRVAKEGIKTHLLSEIYTRKQNEGKRVIVSRGNELW